MGHRQRQRVAVERRDHHYVSFFGWVLVFSIPPVILAWLAPFPHDGKEEVSAGNEAPVGAH